MREGVPATLRLQLLDLDHKPRTDWRYVLELDGRLVGPPGPYRRGKWGAAAAGEQEGEELGERAAEALRAFQRKFGLAENGQPDEATRQRLMQVRGG